MALQVWLPLNGNLDNYGLSNITVTNNGATSNASGKIGSCYLFNENNALSCSNPNIDGSKISASCWVYLTNITNSQYIISLNTNSGWADQSIAIEIESSKVYFCGGSTYCYSSNIQTNVWVHLAVTYNGSILSGYINGELVASTSTTTLINRSVLTIGARYNGSTNVYFLRNAKLNDVRIYDDCLSPQEVKEISRGLILHYKLDFDSNSISNTIFDCSGYKYDGTVNGSISLVSDVPRYESGTQFTTTSYINCTSPTEEARSASFWVKIDSAPTANQVMFVDYKSRLAFGMHYNNALLLTCRDTSIKEKVATAFTLGQWHHVVVVNPGTSPTDTTRTLYIDGVIQAEHATSSYFTHNTDALQIGRRSYSNNSIVNQLVDFRLYATALSAEDALDLYHTSAIVDNLGNLHTFQAKEDNSTPEIMKTGDAVAKNFLELGNRIKTLSDGSVWLHVLHHENPASNMFTENNCWNYDNGSTLYSALWLLQNDVWKYNGKYELLACEKLTSSSSEVQYRWTQTSNPATTSTATGFQLLSGTANKLTDGLVNEGTHGCLDVAGSNWWCCCGAYSQYQSGVPGFGGTITSGSLDLYIRITQDIFKSPESDLFFIYENGYVQNELIEI